MLHHVYPDTPDHHQFMRELSAMLHANEIDWFDEFYDDDF